MKISNFLILTVFCFSSYAAIPSSIPIQQDARVSAEKLLEVLQVGKNYDNAIQQAVEMQTEIMNKKNGSEEQLAQIHENMKSSMEKFSWEKMKPMFIDIYAEVFTAKELDDIIAFYESPAGRKFIEKQPELMSVTMQKMQALMAEIVPDLQKRSSDIAKARNVAEVEKAKAIMTLPAFCKITGAMDADDSTDISSGKGLANLLAILKISDLSELTVDGDAINIGDMKTKASY